MVNPALRAAPRGPDEGAAPLHAAAVYKGIDLGEGFSARYSRKQGERRVLREERTWYHGQRAISAYTAEAYDVKECGDLIITHLTFDTQAPILNP